MIRNIAVYFAVVSVLFSACSKRGNVGADAVRTVKTDTVVVYNAVRQSLFPGKIYAATEVGLSFRIAGPVAEISVKEGDYVRRGQTLARLDPRDYEIQLSATEAEYKQIKAEADRVIALHSSGSVTDNDCDKAVYGLKQITAKYEAHKNALADTRLVAPFDGYIQKRYFESGETVGAGMPVISLIDASAPEVVINIPSSEYIKRDLFDKFFCTVDIYPEKIFPLDLIGITRKANMNQLYTVRLKMRKSDTPLPAPGMATMVTVGFKPDSSALVQIPSSALFEKNSVSAVWIYDAHTQTVSARTVTVLEIHSDGSAVISDGLSVGETVISAGVNYLNEGEKVRLLPPATESNAGNLL